MGRGKYVVRCDIAEFKCLVKLKWIGKFEKGSLAKQCTLRQIYYNKKICNKLV